MRRSLCVRRVAPGWKTLYRGAEGSGCVGDVGAVGLARDSEVGLGIVTEVGMSRETLSLTGAGGESVKTGGEESTLELSESSSRSRGWIREASGGRSGGSD
jgi:hypothetical protein